MGFNVTVERKRMSSYLIGSASYDDLMLILVRTDFTTVIALVLSFLAVVLGFDAICGEREQGTLKLVLSNPVSRGQLVAAKLLGGGIALWLSLAVAFTISLLILLTNSAIQFGADDWLRLTLIFALSCLLLLVVYALSVMVSTFTRSPATSLILCLFGWLIGGVGYATPCPRCVAMASNTSPTRAIKSAGKRSTVATGRTQRVGSGPSAPG
jgi:ABC-2 type transport system permease protein